LLKVLPIDAHVRSDAEIEMAGSAWEAVRVLLRGSIVP
jgi:hypothetical protein